MTIARQDETNFDRWGQDQLRSLRPWLRGRRIWWIAGTLALAAGAAFNWSWLVAIGVAPLLVAALPCAAMCALGLCMNRMMGRSCSKEAAPDQASSKADAQLPLRPELTNAALAVGRTAAPAALEEIAPAGGVASRDGGAGWVKPGAQ